MVELRRSATSFRRYGSSGLVWDDKLVLGANVENQNQDVDNRSTGVTQQKQSQNVKSISMFDRSKSQGAQPYIRVKVASTSKDLKCSKSTCWSCGILGNKVLSNINPSQLPKDIGN
ncbi:hypothetical protein TanjilG_26777 [Lupinus angustifolius]|uniref:MAPK kinase substrate protein n=1 Tax=Lupinus angustifolius TaxID=3871 RepID=A0A1J7GA28_LUPAN|nr:hypothetical protein TanjilG_26777 [Lupinus angustifolius]